MLLWVGFYVELLNSFYDMRPALPDFYRNDPCLHFGGFEAQEGHRGFPAVGVALVEHEIAEAVEYGVGADVFQGLHDVRMVPDDGIRPGLHQFVGVVTLLYVGMGLEFRAPVQDGDDERRRMLRLVLPDAACQPVDGRTAYIRLAFRMLPVFKREEHGVEDSRFDTLFSYDGRGELFFRGMPVAQGGDAGCAECLVGVGQSLPPLVEFEEEQAFVPGRIVTRGLDDTYGYFRTTVTSQVTTIETVNGIGKFP